MQLSDQFYEIALDEIEAKKYKQSSSILQAAIACDNFNGDAWILNNFAPVV